MENFNATEYDQTAGKLFAPVYPVIAEQIVNKTQKTKGKCLDIGTGPGYLGIAIAKITNLDVCLFDISEKALSLANEKIVGEGLETRMKTLLGDVHNIPLDDSSVDLVISRGSFIFWKDKSKAFAEIFRILAPGGFAYVGGGFGTDELRAEIEQKSKERNDSWEERRKKLTGDNFGEKIVEALMVANIPDYKIVLQGGFWVIMRK
ncbi:2-methoxy-6-polyprenyl-1,4-benzoquinol methylase, mitochondrial [Sporomusa silvacetica DSM 10669]|uniref:2-methoxy-6-polyprenyl-1,4-benzoquinol methylase, mitochondrial n=1 Tax=Sporomusa silvacetica DSM 10669 TaxID=1123289 RepID=A0ABZ3IN47_9FIRM|nr:class I SAM-dependent methyltransferase [Sporomusa silvacetica]OZC15070.1 demethylrebeccamycin-D-glucose O-methyltransferase [Sporomusa silvacetica DSM 10669]